MDRYAERSGEPLTYQALADKTGIARSTIESLATRPNYNPSLKIIAALCEALECTPGELLELHTSGGSRTAKRKS